MSICGRLCMKKQLLFLLVCGLITNLNAMEQFVDPHSVYIVTDKSENQGNAEENSERVVMVNAKLGKNWLMPLYSEAGKNDPLVMKPQISLVPGEGSKFVYKKYNGVRRKGELKDGYYLDNRTSSYYGDILLVPREDLEKQANPCYYKAKDGSHITCLKSWNDLVNLVFQKKLQIQKSAALDLLVPASPLMTRQKKEPQSVEKVHEQVSVSQPALENGQVAADDIQQIVDDTVFEDHEAQEGLEPANENSGQSSASPEPLPPIVATTRPVFVDLHSEPTIKCHLYLNKKLSSPLIEANTSILIARKKDELNLLLVGGNEDNDKKYVLVDRAHEKYDEYSPALHGLLEWVDISNFDLGHGGLFQIAVNADLEKVCVPYIDGQQVYECDVDVFSGTVVHRQVHQQPSRLSIQNNLQEAKRSWNGVFRGMKQFFLEPTNTALFITGCFIIGGIVYFIVRTIKKEKQKKAAQKLAASANIATS